MTWKPHVTVAAVIEKNQKFLLVEELVHGEKVFNQPAGHLEPNEDIIDAIIRETREETTCDFLPQHLVGLYRWQLPHQENLASPKSYVRYAFSGQVSDPVASRVLDQDILDTHWFSYDEVIQRTSSLRSPLVMHCIEDYLSGEKFPLSMLKDIRND